MDNAPHSVQLYTDIDPGMWLSVQNCTGTHMTASFSTGFLLPVDFDQMNTNTTVGTTSIVHTITFANPQEFAEEDGSGRATWGTMYYAMKQVHFF